MASLLPSATKADVPALFWTAASWAGELSMIDNPLLRIGEIATVRALFTRALELDESWGGGTIARSDDCGGRIAGARWRVARPRPRALRTRGGALGHSAFAYVTLASSVSAPARNCAEFERSLKQALATDATKKPELRLANLVAQKRARSLLANADRMLK